VPSLHTFHTLPGQRALPDLYPERVEEAYILPCCDLVNSINPTFLCFLCSSAFQRFRVLPWSKSVAHAKHASGPHASNSENLYTPVASAITAAPVSRAASISEGVSPTMT